MTTKKNITSNKTAKKSKSRPITKKPVIITAKNQKTLSTHDNTPKEIEVNTYTNQKLYILV